jgi:YidC/Oxa1 family membrane protein insertase
MWFTTFLIQPLYNAFIYLIGVMGGDVGLAIIAMTLVIRAVFYPIFSASIRTQMGMQKVQGELDEINKKYKDDADERARRTMELFKQHKVRPFAGLLGLVVQIPIFIALYYAFFREGLPHIAANLLYSFVAAPTAVNTHFLGLLNLLAAHNVALGMFVGFLQWAVVKLSLGRAPAPSATQPADKAQAQRMQQQMMLYAMPVLYAVITYTLPAAAGLYFAATNIISLGQEWLIRRELKTQK